MSLTTSLTNPIHKEKVEMAEQPDSKEEFKRSIGVKWIKAESGSTYLCPVDALDRIENPTEDQLKLMCIDESDNPQNE